MEYTCCVRRQCYCDKYFLDKLSRSSRPDVLCKEKVFSEISQNSQESTCARDSFLIKLQATLLKKSLWHRSFLVNFAKFLRTDFLQNTSGRLLLAFCKFSLVRSDESSLIKVHIMSGLDELVNTNI